MYGGANELTGSVSSQIFPLQHIKIKQTASNNGLEIVLAQALRKGRLAKNKGDLLIGRDTKNWMLRYDGPAHLLTIALTRSGKGVGTIFPIC